MSLKRPSHNQVQKLGKEEQQNATVLPRIGSALLSSACCFSHGNNTRGLFRLMPSGCCSECLLTQVVSLWFSATPSKAGSTFLRNTPLRAKYYNSPKGHKESPEYLHHATQCSDSVQTATWFFCLGPRFPGNKCSQSALLLHA